MLKVYVKILNLLVKNFFEYTNKQFWIENYQIYKVVEVLILFEVFTIANLSLKKTLI